MANLKVFHAGTLDSLAGVVTNGGRVLGVTALGSDLANAQHTAYAGVKAIHFEGAHWRNDIGGRALHTKSQ
jgi:phosphoribosylamine--glycine ligase